MAREVTDWDYRALDPNSNDDGRSHRFVRSSSLVESVGSSLSNLCQSSCLNASEVRPNLSDQSQTKDQDTHEYRESLSEESFEIGSFHSNESASQLSCQSSVNQQLRCNEQYHAATTNTIYPTITPKKKVQVFMTYTLEPNIPTHFPTVHQIALTLKKLGIEVAIDIWEELLRNPSNSKWLEHNIRTSTFILICISPGYKRVVDEETNEEKALNTKYIYRQIHNEYIACGSKNIRLVPVLLSGASRVHAPMWLRDTKLFRWCVDLYDILNRLNNVEKYIKPKTGPIPKLIFERYTKRSNANFINET